MKEKTKRCAIYTRKSVEEGLDMEFNSLDAQREAGEAYIASQKANWWVCLPIHYDDGGFSGGNTNRPALKQLLADCQAGLIDIVVVCKIDRLSRSICDFAELTKFFDKWGVSFCSVTQDINTSTSSGRMMLNILVTFAQYEREIIGERIRDKFAASKKKGLWMGGAVPLGYRVENRKLVVAPEEAEVVRRIYDRFMATQSPKQVANELNADGMHTKTGKPWNKANMYHILRNCIYIGKMPYKGEQFDGEHEPIVEQEIWNKVQTYLASDAETPQDLTRQEANIAPLKGLVFCGHCGGSMIQVSTRKLGKACFYYKCSRDSKRSQSCCPIRQVSAAELERAVFTQLAATFRTPMMAARLKELTGIDGAQMSDAMSGNFLDEASNGEKRRLAELLLAGVKLYKDRMELEIKAEGIRPFKEQIDNENND